MDRDIKNKWETYKFIVNELLDWMDSNTETEDVLDGLFDTNIIKFINTKVEMHNPDIDSTLNEYIEICEKVVSDIFWWMEDNSDIIEVLAGQFDEDVIKFLNISGQITDEDVEEILKIIE